MEKSYWSFKTLTLCAIAAGLEWIHYRDFRGRALLRALMLVYPYVLSLALPRKWIGPSIAIPIGAALVLVVPLLLSLVFLMGYNHNLTGDPRLFLILLLIVAIAIAAFVAGAHNRHLLKGWGWGVIVTTLGSVTYYVYMLLHLT